MKADSFPERSRDCRGYEAVSIGVGSREMVKRVILVISSITGGGYLAVVDADRQLAFRRRELPVVVAPLVPRHRARGAERCCG